MLEGKVAVITGAASGIGAESARLFAREGAKVVLADVQDDRCARLADELGPNAAFVHTDVTDEAQVGAAVRFAVERFGRLDCMFNNAGRGHAEGLITDLTPALYHDVVDLLLGGVLFGTKHAAAVMKAQKSGSIINTASVAGIRGLPGHGAYSASKAAAISYCESLRGECAPSGVKVVTLLPGYIDTPLTRGNRYSMPFLMPVEAFADRAYAAIVAGDSYRVIPWQMGVVAKLLRLLPNALYDRALSKRGRKRRRQE